MAPEEKLLAWLNEIDNNYVQGYIDGFIKAVQAFSELYKKTAPKDTE